MLIFTLFLISNHLISQCVQGDCQNGEGTMVYSSGNKYQGHFKNGMKDGYGKFIWVSGAKYKGDWVSNKRQGEGEEILANGTRYVGQFFEDKKHGSGKLYDNNGNVVQSGQWINGEYVSSKEASISNTNSKVVSTSKNNWTKYINLGVGLGSSLGTGYSSFNSTYSSIPPISISAEFMKLENGITIGGYIGYSSDKLTYKDDFFGNYGWKTSYKIFGARGSYYFNVFHQPKINTYVGAMIGYNIVSSSYFGDDYFSNQYSASVSGFTWSGFIGMRYLFGEKMGAFAELGYGISYFTLGITTKF